METRAGIQVYSRGQKADPRELKPESWFVERLDVWKGLLGLNHWKVNLRLKSRLRDEAFVKTYPHLLEADITFRQSILASREDVVVVHELLHVLTDDWSKAVDDVINNMVPLSLKVDATRRVREREELVIEALAHAFIRTRGEKESGPAGNTPGVETDGSGGA